MADAFSHWSLVGRLGAARWTGDWDESSPELADSLRFNVNPQLSANLGQTGRPMFVFFEKWHPARSWEAAIGPWSPAACHTILRILRQWVGHSGPDWPTDWV